MTRGVIPKTRNIAACPTSCSVLPRRKEVEMGASQTTRVVASRNTKRCINETKLNMLPKNPECKKHIQYSEQSQSTLCFSGQAQVAQKS